MALRVLLADESTTIKKVMQLALQDFAVEVKAVHSGLDVVEVARGFQPDIVFADILLPKRTGYDVCGDLKKDPSLRSTPVVLMWSSFMDLDEKAYLNAKANGKLEKPFDIEGLRSVILELVPKTQTQRLAHFLKFPGSFVEPLNTEEKAKETEVAQPRAAMAPAPTHADPTGAVYGHAVTAPPADDEGRSSRWNMDSFDKLSNFTEEVLDGMPDEDQDDEPVKITKLGTGAIRTGTLGNEPQPPTADDGGEPWSHQDLARFKLDIPAGDIERDEISLVFDIDGVESPSDHDFLLNKDAPVAEAPKARREERGRTGSVTAIRANDPSYHTAEHPTDDLELEPADLYKPIAQIPGPSGEPISQFAGDSEASAMLQLEDDEQATIAGAQPVPVPERVPDLTLDQLERIVRSQSQDIIEALVRRVVPEIATDLIRKELDRLLRESPGGS